MWTTENTELSEEPPTTGILLVLLKGRIELHAGASVFFACSVNIKLPFDKRGIEERIPTQVTKDLVRQNLASKNVHPAQAELTDGAGTPGPVPQEDKYKHVLQLLP